MQLITESNIYKAFHSTNRNVHFFKHIRNISQTGHVVEHKGIFNMFFKVIAESPIHNHYNKIQHSQQ